MTAESPTPETDSKEMIHEPEPAFGWTAYAERMNGRFAMIGFVALLILQFVTHENFFTWIGLF
jgi:hypothetical protein